MTDDKRAQARALRLKLEAAGFALMPLDQHRALLEAAKRLREKESHANRAAALAVVRGLGRG